MNKTALVFFKVRKLKSMFLMSKTMSCSTLLMNLTDLCFSSLHKTLPPISGV